MRDRTDLEDAIVEGADPALFAIWKQRALPGGPTG
jgi:hypothetical protein